MNAEQSKARDLFTMTMEARAAVTERTTSQDTITVECYAADGTLLWREATTKGENHVNVG